MKTSIQKEGFNLSSRHDFGDPCNYFSQYQLVVSYDLNIGIDTITQSMHYRETEDDFLQIVGDTDLSSPVIIAQFKRSGQALKYQIKEILLDYIRHSRFLVGFPERATLGGLLSTEEFDSLIADLITEFERNIQESLKNPPPLTNLFKEYGLEPHPNENGGSQWLANCPRCRKFYIVFWKDNLRWGCARCGFHGEGEEEFRNGLRIIRNPTD